ncbi:MAG: glycerophosphoryl diester phosphodiesterase membrane domain-containing protein, partial [Acidaminobacteraceae bacterium]
MRVIWNEYKINVLIYKKNFFRFLKYQITSKIILSIIMLPIFYWLAAKLMNNRGYQYLTNGLIQKFILSPQGFILIIIGIVFGLMVILMEIGGLTILSYQAIKGQKESSYLEVLKYSLGKIKYFAGIDGFFMIFYLFLIAPFLGSNVRTSALSSIKIPGFVMDFINSKELYQMYLSSIFMVFVLLSIRWIFSIHIVLLSDKKVKHPLHESGKLLKKEFKYILKYVICVFAINAAIVTVATAIIVLITIVIMLFITESM